MRGKASPASSKKGLNSSISLGDSGHVVPASTVSASTSIFSLAAAKDRVVSIAIMPGPNVALERSLTEMNFEYCSALQPLDLEEADQMAANTGISPLLDLMQLPCDLPALDLDGNFYISAPDLAAEETKPAHVAVSVQCAAKTTNIGALTYSERLVKLQRYREKRSRRVWKRRVHYECRKKVADGRVRVKGRFVTKADAVRITKEKKNTAS